MNDNASPNGDVNRKVPVFYTPEAHTKTSEEWRSLCVVLYAEIERLQAYILELNEQRLTAGIMDEVPEDVKKLKDMSEKEILAMCEGQQSLEDILRELGCKAGI